MVAAVATGRRRCVSSRAYELRRRALTTLDQAIDRLYVLPEEKAFAPISDSQGIGGASRV